MAENQPPRKPYYGKPENQRDSKALVRTRPTNKNPKKGPPTGVQAAPASLPPPRHLHDASHVKLTEVSPADSAIFSRSVSVRETNNNVTFTPAAPAALDVSRETYLQILTDDANFSKVVLPEYTDYYTTALVWFRIITLKAKNRQALTAIEEDIRQLIESLQLCVPEPIFLQLRALGNVVSPTGQHLYPEFPPLPVEQIGGFGGYYGELDENTHNLYEELPCLGVTAEAVRQTVSVAPAGPYVSALAPQNQPCNGNLLGFRPLGHRRQEPKDFAAQRGITNDQFRCYPPNTMINIEFLSAISDQLALTKTFRLNDVVFSTLSEIGGQAQTTVQHPIPDVGTRCSQGEVRVTSLSKVSSSVFGSGAFFLPQLMKEPGGLNQHNTWCCITGADLHPIPPAWIQNRNIRRNLPDQYATEAFTSVSLHAAHHRADVIKGLVLNSR